VLVVVSLLLHSPFTPLAALFGLFGLLTHDTSGEQVPEEAITAIPIDLIPDEEPDPGGQPAEKPAPKPASEKDPFDELEKSDREPKTQLEPEHRPEAEQDAGPSDAGADALVAMADSGASDGGAGVGAGKAIGDPVAASGSAGKIADSNANVRLIVYNERLRNHAMGPRVATLLSQAYQWRDFFGPAKLDPIHDVDRMLIAGPQFKQSSNVVAVLHYNVSQDRMKRAIDALVQRDAPAGGWLDGGVPAATAHADRAERLFVLPAPNILVVAPPSAAAHALKLGRDTRLPPARGPEVLMAYVVTPWRAFVGIPFNFPHSIKWVRMKVTPSADGGAVATLVAEDESAESAQRNAEQLQKQMDAVTQIKLGALGALFGRAEHKVIERVTLVAQGNQIHGTVVATPRQLGALLEAIAQAAKQFAEDNARKAQAAKPQPAADAGAERPKPPPAESADAG
jgi:hypothetical protein